MKLHVTYNMRLTNQERKGLSVILLILILAVVGLWMF